LLTDRYLNGIPSDSRMAKEHFLTSDKRTPELLEYLLQIQATAAEQGDTIAQHALRWVLDQRGVTSVLVGASSTQQLQKNLKCVGAAPFENEEL
jgi:L-glyceraldehyde 3-phosphate reductase